MRLEQAAKVVRFAVREPVAFAPDTVSLGADAAPIPRDYLGAVAVIDDARGVFHRERVITNETRHCERVVDDPVVIPLIWVIAPVRDIDRADEAVALTKLFDG